MWILLASASAGDRTIPRVADAHIAVDGRGDEPAWDGGLLLPDPTVFRPSDDVTPVGSMTTTLLADDDALYVRFVVTDPEPDRVRAGLGRRDTRPDDLVGLYLDPAADGRRAYVFLVNPSGVQLDRLHLPGGDDDDWSWDGVWRSAGRRTPTGYEVEAAIPWATARLAGEPGNVGVVVFRKVARRGQSYAWPRVDPGTDPILAEAALALPGTLPGRLGLEILPEVTGAWSTDHVESGRLEVGGVGPGLTLRYRPTTRFGALGTFNPDFSQLESDATQIDVNQRYALYFEEKRPFFLEGQDWLTLPWDDLVYTRSMNAPLYGLRATGEVGNVGVSALHAYDLAPAPSVNEGGGWTADQLDGHAALATLGRVRVGLGGDSYLGAFGSDRTILGTELANRVAGVDSVLRVEKRLTVSAVALGSATTLHEGDAPTLAPAGQLGTLFSGEKVFLHATAEAIAPGFRQENGYVPHADRWGGFTEDHVNLYPGVEWLPLVGIEPVDVWSYWRFDGTARERAWDPSVWARFGNGAVVKLDGRVAGEEFGGAWIDYRNVEAYGSLNVREWLRAEAGGTAGTAPYYDPVDPRAGRVLSAWGGVAFQPVPRFTITLSPEVERMVDPVGDGAPLYVVWTGRARAELFLTPEVWLRGVVQLAGDAGGDPGWRVEPVGAWEWSPGRALYVGGSYGEDPDPAWQVFAKAGWLFTL